MDIAWQGKRRDFYFAIQNLNRATIKYAAGMIKVGMKLPDVKALCENYNDEWRRGLQMEEYLHKTLIDAATPDMTFEEPYYFMDDLSVKKDFLT